MGIFKCSHSWGFPQRWPEFNGKRNVDVQTCSKCGARRESRTWDPEQREVEHDERRVFKVFRPPPKPAVLTQGELPGTQSLGCWAN